MNSLQRLKSEPSNTLHASCVTLRASGARLLGRAQAEGLARVDIDGSTIALNPKDALAFRFRSSACDAKKDFKRANTGRAVAQKLDPKALVG